MSGHNNIMNFMTSDILKYGNESGGWKEFEKVLLKRCVNSGKHNFKYFDEDNEEITLASESDFRAAIEFAKHRNSLMIKAVPVDQWKPYVDAIYPKLNMAEKDHTKPQLNESSKPPDWFTKAFDTLKHEIMSCLEASKSTEDSKESIVHDCVVCDHCSNPIMGVRYKCGNCIDYDLCEKCEASKSRFVIHPVEHIFLKIYKPLPFHANPQSNPLLGNLYDTSENQKIVDNNEEMVKSVDVQKTTERSSCPEECTVNFVDPNDLNVEVLTESNPIVVSPNTTCPVAWRVKNTGNEIWNNSTKLVCVVNGKHTVSDSEVCVPPLMPGETGFVFANIKTPLESGCHCSSWMFRHNNTFFGPNVKCMTDSPESSSLHSEPSILSLTSEQCESPEMKSISSSDNEEFVVIPLPECFKLDERPDHPVIETETTEPEPEQPKPAKKEQSPKQSNVSKADKDPMTGEPLPVLNEASVEPVLPPPAVRTTDDDTGEPIECPVLANQEEIVIQSQPTVIHEPSHAENMASNASEHNYALPTPNSGNAEAINQPMIENALVNAAASAYNSVRRVFTQQQSTEEPPVHFQSPETVSTLQERAQQLRKGAHLLTSMEQLMEMGFCNRKLNQQLLNKYNNDMGQVISVLLDYYDHNWHQQRH